MNYPHLLAGLLLACGFTTAFASNNDIRYGVLCYHDVIDESAPVIKTKEEQEMTSEIQRTYYPQTITVKRLVAHFNWL